MGSARAKWTILIGFLVLFVVVFVYSERDRQTRLHQVVGTWIHQGTDITDEPLVLHIFADHTYLQEGLAEQFGNRGTWSFSNFPDRGHVILKGYVHVAESIGDAIFTLDPVRKALVKTGYSWNFQKSSDETELKLTELERKLLGMWSGQDITNSESKQWLSLLSDHQFMIQYESVGHWHVTGENLILEWISDESHQTQTSKLKIDLAHGRLTFDPEGYSLVRPKPES
ncbi:MAG: hypothetical protein WCG75_03625 [Armatimonadota bacterium]